MGPLIHVFFSNKYRQYMSTTCTEVGKGREGKGRKGKRILHDLRLLVKSMDVELQIQRGDCGT